MHSSLTSHLVTSVSSSPYFEKVCVRVHRPSALPPPEWTSRRLQELKPLIMFTKPGGDPSFDPRSFSQDFSLHPKLRPRGEDLPLRITVPETSVPSENSASLGFWLQGSKKASLQNCLTFQFHMVWPVSGLCRCFPQPVTP